MHHLFTIGHSTHPPERFLALLSRHGVEVVCDVRSSPYSRFNPQHNRETLRQTLKEAGIKYLFLGTALGARSDDPACYVGDRVDYDRLAATGSFRSGIDRLRTGAQSYRVAMMCAEKDPLDCHRTILVARELERRGVDVSHIREDGSLETQRAAIDRLVASMGLNQGDLLAPEGDPRNRAYDARGREIAYVRSAPGRHAVGE